MAETELYTVQVYELARSEKELEENDNNSGEQHIGDDDDVYEPTSRMTFVNKYVNMISAKIMNGRMLELEHIRLAGGPVKFKTVINYNASLKPGNSLGLLMKPQKSYISPV